MTWDADIGDDFIGDICIKYADSIGAVKRLEIQGLEIYSQSS